MRFVQIGKAVMKKRGFYRSDFLFSTGNFWIGAGSILGLEGNYFEFNGSETSRLADYKALLSDWGRMGLDLWGASENYRKTFGKHD